MPNKKSKVTLSGNQHKVYETGWQEPLALLKGSPLLLRRDGDGAFSGLSIPRVFLLVDNLHLRFRC